jgi:cytochrome c peroxidase
VVENGRRAVLDGKGEMNDAILVSGHNFTIQGIEMRNYKANGVVVNQANNVVFRDLVGVNTGKYAVYPVQCDGVLIEGCVVSDVWDAGVYAGQCKNVEIRNNVTFRNTIGIEAENSVNVLIHNNTAFDNSLGILVVLLPNLPSKTASDALVINNRVLNNNYPNLAPEGEIVSMVTPGQGIMVNAADRTEVTNNEIAGHDSFGVVVASLLDTLEAQDAGRDIGGRLDKIDVEPNPDNNLIHGNHYA